MQKKIIALAVAALASSAAFAQSNVTVYGVADGYYAHVSGTGVQSNNYFNSGGLSGSRIGFRGNEDLGNGLKAVFEYELAFNLDNTGKTGSAINAADADNGKGTIGNGLTGTRQSYVGLAGGFGTVVLGRLQTPGYYVGKFDALASSAISPQAILSATLGATIAPSNAGRVNNAVAYMSPNFSGFSAVVAYGSGEENVVNAEKESVVGLGLSYANGPVAVNYTYHNVSNVGATNVAAVPFPNQRENLIAGSYDFGVVKLLASWQDAKATGADKNKLWQIGAVVPVSSAGNVHVAYGKLDMKAADMDAKAWTLAYTHALSKRTTAYAGYNHVSNDDGQTAGLIATPSAGGNTKGLVMGVRHTF